MLHKRPQNKVKRLKGMYLVGGGTHPGSGLPTIYQSAIITSNYIHNDHKKEKHGG
jgi:phytoene desaturase